MRITIFAYSRQGCRTAQEIAACFSKEECQAYTMERFLREGNPDEKIGQTGRRVDGISGLAFYPLCKPTDSIYKETFDWADALIFVGSCGIAVRQIAPYLKSKTTDPAVLCVDELGSFVIPLLSGHIGGANELARRLAVKLGAVPVITTATDINHRFSVDAWAAKNGMVIDSMAAVKAVSARILESPVPIICDFPIRGALPAGVEAGEHGEAGIVVSCQKKAPFRQTLLLIPPILHLGIGCRRGTEAGAIQDAVEWVMETMRLDRRAVKCVATIDLKADEEGLLSFCRENNWPVSFYTAEELQAVEGEFTPSEFVKNVTGVDNVCERAAMIGAGRLLIKKTAKSGVTVAVAAEDLEVCFE